MALPAGLPPASVRLEDGCLMSSATAAFLKWSEWQDLHLRPPGPKPGALKTELHSDEIGGPEGTCTLSLPADNGLLRSLSYESGNDGRCWSWKVNGPRASRAPGPSHFNKEQTPLGDLFDPNPRFHGGCFG